MASMRQEAFDVDQTILRLDQLQEQRVLTESEMAERQTAKGRIIGLAAVRRIKLRQRSRLTWIVDGDANTKMFHLRGNSRRRKNFIPALKVGHRTVTAPAARQTPYTSTSRPTSDTRWLG
jgi:hypothetical protein